MKKKVVEKVVINGAELTQYHPCDLPERFLCHAQLAVLEEVTKAKTANAGYAWSAKNRVVALADAGVPLLLRTNVMNTSHIQLI